MPRPLRVFLCHASQDKPAVRELYKRLKSEGWIDPWLDEEKLLGGQDFDLEIYKATRDADVIIICLSQKSVLKEGYVNKEIRRALDIAQEKREGTIYVIPLRLDECIPSFEQLKKLHWVDYFSPNAHNRLLNSLRSRATELKIKIPEIKSIEIPVKKTIPEIGRLLGIGGFILTMFFLIGLGYNSLFDKTPVTSNATSSPSFTETLKPPVSTNVFFTPIPKPSETPSPTPTLGIGSTIISDSVTMIYIPKGSFSMGGEIYNDDKPIHAVLLDAYYIDKFEVTNASYERCVEANKCNPPRESRSSTRAAYYGNPEFDEYPVIHVDWERANDYCEWRGDRLPTEAEWEKAARGEDGRTYPWGEVIDCDYANYSTGDYCIGDTTKVGSYLDGVSPFGVYDMAGNVWEWVSDWYDENYYKNSPTSNPLGPELGQFRVLRGGSWGDFSKGIRSALREKDDPTHSNSYFGFRCARSP